MIKVGISGKIAAGKSQVEAIIAELGYKVFDLDKISHSLFEEEKVQKLLLNEFETLDRKEKKIMNGKYSRVEQIKSLTRKKTLKKQL